MALPSVQGKTAIVTGSGAGINLSFAKLLLSKGCNVVFADLALRPEAKEVVDAHQSGSPRAVSQQTDVTEWSQLERMFEVADKEFGSVDIVCPGAGVYEPVRRFVLPCPCLTRSGLVKLLGPTRHRHLKRLTNQQPLHSNGYQRDASDPHHPASDCPFPQAQAFRQYSPHR